MWFLNKFRVVRNFKKACGINFWLLAFLFCCLNITHRRADPGNHTVMMVVLLEVTGIWELEPGREQPWPWAMLLPAAGAAARANAPWPPSPLLLRGGTLTDYNGFMGWAATHGSSQSMECNCICSLNYPALCPGKISIHHWIFIMKRPLRQLACRFQMRWRGCFAGLISTELKIKISTSNFSQILPSESDCIWFSRKLGCS